MATAIDVAKFFLSKVDRDNGDVITHLKLQKLVYYSQAWSLVLRGQELFEDTIEAWKNGPVSPSVWDEYKTYADRTPIPYSCDFDEKILSEDELNLLSQIVSTYGEFTASKLWKLSHKEYPWLEARRGIPADHPSKEVITPKSMKDYYSNFVDINYKTIHSEVFSEEKDLGSLITLNDGEKFVQIRSDDLYQYFESNSSEKNKIKVNVRRSRLSNVGS